MLKTIIIDNDLKSLHHLQNVLEANCPHIQVVAKINSIEEGMAQTQRQQPDLVLSEINFPGFSASKVITRMAQFQTELVFVTKDDNYLREAFKFTVTGYVLKPIRIDELRSAIEKAQYNCRIKEENSRNKALLQNMLQFSSAQKLIGIPTIKGFDFIPIQDIIRCEGLQKYTVVVVKSRVNTLSSYNLGEFRKQLEPYGFFSPHKSHLINISYICQYHREGYIVMQDQTHIPIARRKKQEFLTLVHHL